jgi:hypothetical protein
MGLHCIGLFRGKEGIVDEGLAYLSSSRGTVCFSGHEATTAAAASKGGVSIAVVIWDELAR